MTAGLPCRRRAVTHARANARCTVAGIYYVLYICMYIYIFFYMFVAIARAGGRASMQRLRCLFNGDI